MPRIFRRRLVDFPGEYKAGRQAGRLHSHFCVKGRARRSPSNQSAKPASEKPKTNSQPTDNARIRMNAPFIYPWIIFQRYCCIRDGVRLVCFQKSTPDFTKNHHNEKRPKENEKSTPLTGVTTTTTSVGLAGGRFFALRERTSAAPPTPLPNAATAPGSQHTT